MLTDTFGERSNGCKNKIEHIVSTDHFVGNFTTKDMQILSSTINNPVIMKDVLCAELSEKSIFQFLYSELLRKFIENWVDFWYKNDQNSKKKHPLLKNIQGLDIFLGLVDPSLNRLASTAYIAIKCLACMGIHQNNFIFQKVVKFA